MSIFRDKEHARKWANAIDKSGAIAEDHNKINPAFGASLFIITAMDSLDDYLSSYIYDGWIDFETMIENRYDSLSSGERILVNLAGNLYNGVYKCTPHDFLSRCDRQMINVAITAIQLRVSQPELETIFK